MRPRALLAVALLAGAVIVGVRATTLIAPAGARLSPVEVTVTPSSSLPPEVQALERASVANLFDRNTASEYTAFDHSVVEAGLEAASDIAAIKVFGPAPYVMSVDALSNGTWRAVTGWQKLRLDQGSSGAWGTYAAGAPINATRLRFTLDAAPGGGGGKGNKNTATGLAEIELWSGAGRKLARGAGALEAAITEAQSAAGTSTPNFAGIAARRYGATPDSATINLTQAAEFHAQLDRAPAQAKRAWVVYESYGYAHWISPLIAVNDVAAQGGAFQLTGSDWVTQRVPVSPLWLAAGDNRVRFAVPANTRGAFSVRNVRLLVEYDDGGNFISAAEDEAGKAVDAVLDGDSTTGWRIYRGAQSATLTLRFDRPTQLDRLLLNLAERLDGTLRVEVLSGGTWTSAALPTVNGKNLTIGWSSLGTSTAAPVDALRLIFEHGAGSIAEIRELVLLGSGAGAAYAPEIVVGYPDAGQYFGRRAYIRGFVQPADNGSGPARIFVGGQEITHRVGEIEALVSKDDIGYKNQADTDAWQVTVDALYPDGAGVSRTLQLGQYGDASRVRGALPGMASPGFAQALAVDGASLDIEPDALVGDEQIQITPLAEADLPRLDPGMTNVTKGPRRGYRFLPTPHKFRKPIKVTMAYDPGLVPRGLTESDIKTYYFDKDAGHWVALDKARLDTAKKTVTSLTDHFTDMINATLVVPDHPQAVSFNPTQIKDIKAADPGAGINLIEPPRANNMGDARLSYPIEIPPGRAGMQPQLAIQYNSGGGNGWLGMGWDLAVPSISIDTRWGVPRYDGANETETYTLAGEMLTPVAHRGELQPRTPEKTFHARVEGQFRRIVRHGNAPDSYWWEVTEKNGTRYFYGGTPETGKLNDAVLAAPGIPNVVNPGIYNWALVEMRDANRNSVRYHYARVDDTGVYGGSEPGTNLYVKSIAYTGGVATDGPYSVTFTRDRELNEPRRADVQIDARGGAKRVTADLLRRVEVKFNGAMVRAYELRYNENAYGDGRTGTAFNKTLLTAIVQYGSDGTTEFNRHTFAYIDEIRKAGNYDAFALTPWGITGNGLHGDFISGVSGFRDEASALSGQKGSGSNTHIAVSVGRADGENYCKSNTVGGKLGWSSRSSQGVVALVDIDGDGLPDKVVNDGALKYYPNLAKPGKGPMAFSPNAILVGGQASRFSADSARSRDSGVEAVLGCEAITATAGVNSSNTTTTTSVYFSDVNGDGLLDIVDNGQVYFNRPQSGADGTPAPTLLATSAGTPNPIYASAAAASATVSGDQAKLLLDQLTDQYPLHDTVRVWEAPYNGNVAVTGAVQLVQDTSKARTDYGDKADGVRVAIQVRGSELWSARIQGTDYAAKTPTGVDSISVQKGDRIYFRVQSVFDGAFDHVSWAPRVQYVGAAPVIDANGKAVSAFAADSDMLLAALPGQTVSVPAAGQIAIQGTFVKPATSDDVTVRIFQNATVIWEQTFAAAQAASVPLSLAPNVNANDSLRFVISSDSSVDWKALSWPLQIYYLQSADRSINVVDAQGQPQIHLKPAYEISLYGDAFQPSAPAPWIAAYNGQVSISPAAAFSDQTNQTNGSFVLTVKRLGAAGVERLAKRSYAVVNGVVEPTLDPSQLTLPPVNVSAGDALWIEYHSTSIGTAMVTAAKATVAYTRVNAANGATPPLPAPATMDVGYYAPRSDTRFGPMYRQWGQFVYNGNRDRATQPIIESDLYVDPGPAATTDFGSITDPNALNDQLKQQGYDPTKAKFILMLADFDRGRWIGYDDETWVEAGGLSSSRLGDDDIRVNTAIGAAGTGASAPARVAESSDTSYQLGGGASIDGFGASGGASYTPSGSARTLVDFMDLNGDRYPDVVLPGAVQYTTTAGGLESAPRTVLNFDGNPREQDTSAKGVNGGGSYSKSIQKKQGTKDIFEASMNEPSVGINGSYGRSDDEESAGWADVNGDGLPDRVYRGGEVRLNLGYRFGNRERWIGNVNDPGFAHTSQGEGTSSSAGLGFNVGAFSIAGGLSLSRSDNDSRATLFDVNGDGLPDRVTAGNPLRVAFNTGSGFTDEVDWNGASAITAGSSTSESVSGYFTVCVPIFVVKVCVNPGAGASHTMNRQNKQLLDIDGDGLPDFLQSANDGDLTVSRNLTGRTNLLKEVKRPLGAAIALDYKRSGNTYDQPHSKWVLASTAVFDGRVGNGPDYQISTYDYADGKYDRQERDFYGYRTVTETQRNTSNVTALAGVDVTKLDAYRTVTRSFLTDSYYRKGLVERERMTDAQGAPYTETANTYALFDVNAGMAGADNLASSLTATLFPAVVKTEHHFFEGGQGEKITAQSFEYDGYGNVIHFVDAGDTGAADDVQALIDYKACADNYIVGKASRITVMDGAGRTLRHREGDISCDTGNMTQVRQYVEGGVATTDLFYEDNGNLKSVRGPANATGQQYELKYAYDDTVATYPVSIADSFNYTSTATYNYLYGKPLTTTDLNGNVISYAYDLFGRTVSIVGPYEQGKAVTIAFDYHPWVQLDQNPFVSWAKTAHYDRDAKGIAKDTIDTYLFTDGLKRVLQTKKDVTVEGLGDVMTVSGQVEFDAYGRTVKQYYPVTEPKGNNGVFNPTFDSVAPTQMAYDVLDRNTSTQLPDLTTTTMAYGFGADRDGALRFRTTVTDANGKVKESYRDIRQLITSVKEFNAGNTLWTSYDYDPLKQITRVIDAKGNTTTVAYDQLGRRTAIDNPDTGRTETVYDLASNPIRKITAVLRLKNEAIDYAYEFNRLASITYPEHTGNDVTYTYGDPTPAFRQYNQVGRIVKITSQAGVDERRYGKLGEVVQETKTVSSATQGQSANSPEVYTTQYDFDTFGRLMTLTLPDGETLTNAYDSGGNLARIEGDKRGDHTVYLQSLLYDKFEQRTSLKLGNGIETRYTYRADNRRLANLKSEGSVAGRFQNLGYTYDAVGNITDLANDVAIPPASGMGGPTASHFGYDDLYRLTHADGNFKSSPNKAQAYTLDLQYDAIHNIVQKIQNDAVTSNGGKPVPQKATSYNWAYAYAGAQPHAPSHIGDRSFFFDANGNQTGFTNDKNGTRRTIVWDEENRIQEIDDNGRATRFKYDDAGQRVFKIGEQGETVYVNQFYVVRNRSIVSKHVFAGTSRIATKLVGGTGNTRVPAPGASAQGNAYGQTQNPGQGNAYGRDKQAQGNGSGAFPGQGLEHRSDTANEHAQNTEKNPHFTGTLPGQGIANRSARANDVSRNVQQNPNLAGSTITDGGSPGGSDWKPEGNFLYFYHPDHLGSTGYVTDGNGKLYEHLEYFPFGETWVQEHSNTLRTPYLFTGKELDQETGLYYFGARYYDPRTSVWQSPDPILARYLPPAPNSAEEIVKLLPPSVYQPLARMNLPGLGGVFNPVNLALFTFTGQNPIRYVDPDGKETETKIEAKPTGSASVDANKGTIADPTIGFTIVLSRRQTERVQSTAGTDPVPTSQPNVPVSATPPSIPSKMAVAKELWRQAITRPQPPVPPAPGQLQTTVVEKSFVSVELSAQVNYQGQIHASQLMFVQPRELKSAFGTAGWEAHVLFTYRW